VSAVLLVVYFLLSAFATPRQSIDVIAGDPDKSLPYHDPSIPFWANTMLSLIAPIVFVVVVQTVGPYLRLTSTFEIQEIHHAALGLFEAFSLSMLVVKVIKLVAGSPRPNYFNNPHQETSGRESFPSAPACLTWMGWVFFVLFLCGKTTPFQPKSSVSFVMVLASLSPLVVPIVVSVSTYVDNQNRWVDIVGGGLIGAFISLVVYWGLFKSDDGVPKNGRGGGGGGGAAASAVLARASASDNYYSRQTIKQ
jgi:membrane-associated phospholipid phosphatase